MVSKKYIRIFLQLFIPSAVIIIILTSWITYREFYSHKTNSIASNRAILKLTRELIEKTILDNIAQTLYLKDITQKHLGISTRLSLKNKNNLEKSFFRFAKNIKQHNQIRYIDETGKEVVRVDYVGNQVSATPKNQLQNKSHRPYFQKTAHLQEDDIYVSQLDLNIEHGRVEIPFNPVIRFASPIFTKKKEHAGIIVLNHFGQPLLNRINSLAETRRDQIMLVTNDGYFIRGLTPAEDWGFTLPSRREMNIRKFYPALWQHLKEEPNASVISTPRGIFLIEHLAQLKGKIKNDDLHVNVLGFIPRNHLYQPIMTYYYIVLSILLVVTLLITALMSLTKLRKQIYEEQIETMAKKDPLTGLSNRFEFFNIANLELSRSKRYFHNFSLIMLDIDLFKQVNDKYGHLIGDLTLKMLAKKSTECVRDADTVGRYGGEEFVFLLPETSLSNAKKIAEKLRRTIGKLKIPHDGGFIQVAVSLGVSGLDNKLTIEEVIQKADDALYLAKHQGRNRVRTEEDL